MSTVAEQLRAAREAQNLTVHQVADITKLRTDHIRALEEGNFDVFVAPVYIRGFTRTYAKVLKLDVPALIKALDAELSLTEKFSEPPPLTEGGGGAVNWITLQLSKLNLHRREILIGLGVLIVVWIAYASWRARRTADPSRDLPPARVQTGGSKSGSTLPVPATAPKH